MIKKTLFSTILLLVFPLSLFANENTISNLYTAAGIEGTLLIQSLDKNTEYKHNSSRIDQAYIPASTFKIPNTLIALEEGVIKSPLEIIKWDGIKREYPPWNEDQTLATAFARSCVWCYQKFAIKIGNLKYKKYLHEFNYGNSKTGKNITSFWLDGDLRVSAREQINFLRKVYLEKLPIKHKNIKILKDIMLSESTSSYKLWAKTGWKGQHGWFVGYIETDNKIWFFANHIKINSQSDLAFRKKLTIASLKLKGIIHTPEI